MESKHCIYCDKEIEGYNANHVNYLLRQHILSKHPEKFEEVMKGGKENEES